MVSCHIRTLAIATFAWQRHRLLSAVSSFHIRSSFASQRSIHSKGALTGRRRLVSHLGVKMQAVSEESFTELRNGTSHTNGVNGDLSKGARTATGAVIISAAEESSMELAGKILRTGGLVAFPTETVYGLGANALDEKAVKSIFHAKGRPYEDPLIVHVVSAEAALEVLDFEGNDEQRAIFFHLAASFWPGPLTMISTAKHTLPLVVTAGLGKVGVRSPAHPVAAKLLKLAGCPVAAPSANRFGHVSPTSAIHVHTDLCTWEHGIVHVLDGGNTACAVGIESTVASIDAGCIRILRQGPISQENLSKALEGSPFSHWSVQIGAGLHVDDAQAQTSPGQLLRHYSPDIETFQVTLKSLAAEGVVLDACPPAEDSVILDIGGQLQSLSSTCTAYRDLSPSGNPEEVARDLFGALRWGERMGAKRILIAMCLSGGMSAAVNDRTHRAASGKLVYI